jgi:hypothetical protein
MREPPIYRLDYRLDVLPLYNPCTSPSKHKQHGWTRISLTLMTLPCELILVTAVHGIHLLIIYLSMENVFIGRPISPKSGAARLLNLVTSFE